MIKLLRRVWLIVAKVSEDWCFWDCGEELDWRGYGIGLVMERNRVGDGEE